MLESNHDEDPPGTTYAVLLVDLLEAFLVMPHEMQENCLRLTKRIAGLAPEVQRTITADVLHHMLENEANYPYN